MKRRILIVSVAAIGLGAGIFFMKNQGANAAKPAAAPVASMTVSVVSPSQADFARVIAATGTVSARDELLVGSDASGVRLLEVLTDVGSVVQKGQLLARGDDTQLQAQLAAQVATVKQMRAEAAQADANLERAEKLKDSGVYSFEALQTRRTAAATAAAKVELALAQQRELEVKIAHTRVVAPASGVISKRSATVGAVVSAGSELFRLIKDGELEWRAELPSHSLMRVTPGAIVRIDLGENKTLDARVRLVAPTIDAATRNGQVYVTLPKGVALKAGGHARGEILMSSAQALALPETAVMARDGYPFVYTVGDDRVARLTKIETGSRQGGMVEVSSGLGAESRVVATGAGFVKDGDLVRIAPQNKSVQVGASGGKS
jgi:HlyD family secretion protein